MQRSRLWACVGSAVIAALGCGSTSESSSSGGVTGCGDLVEAKGSEFCADDLATPDCSLVTGVYKASVCGVPLKQPPGELKRSENVEEYAGSGPPDLSCFVAGNYPTAGTSKTITIKGTVKIFSSGCESSEVKIEAFKVKRTGGADEADLGEPIGAAVTTGEECQTTGIATDDPEKCGTRYECKYEYAGVPSETEIVLKTSGSPRWASLYEFNVYAPNSELEGETWAHDVRALAQDDYTVIPQAAIGSLVTATHGVVAGEVHDCNNVRLVNATVDVDVDKVITTYFTSNEEHPLPDLSAKGTSTLGLYAAMDLKPGPVTVAATGLVNGELVTVGFYRARVFEDAVTSVTFRGLRPFQAQ